MLFFRNLFKKADETTVTRSVNRRVISDSYKKIEKEIDSLRLYDKGEKKIDAPNLRDAVRGVQRTS